jgi:hypothetical protein
VLVLAMLRHDQRLLDLAGGNGIPESTLRHRRDEMIGLLAAKAPRLDRALRKIAKRGGEAVLIDGALIPTQRRTGADDRLDYSGKHHRHGPAFPRPDRREGQADLDLRGPAGTDPRRDRRPPRQDHPALEGGRPRRARRPGLHRRGQTQEPRRPGHRHRLKATRARKLTPGQKQANRILAAGRASVEHGFANLKAWRIITKLRTDPAHATALLRALLVLTNIEVNR